MGSVNIHPPATTRLARTHKPPDPHLILDPSIQLPELNTLQWPPCT